MTAQTLPDEPNFCFCPAYDVETEVQQIRIVIEGLSGHVPTALVTLHLDDALNICDKLNRRLGLDREAWQAMVAASMRAEDDDPGQRSLALTPPSCLLSNRLSPHGHRRSSPRRSTSSLRSRASIRLIGLPLPPVPNSVSLRGSPIMPSSSCGSSLDPRLRARPAQQPDASPDRPRSGCTWTAN